ncbi:hypothetical protein RHA1_ro04296 [Rhodococcus jostii RHA1]|uniref:Uncharacterized protein n=1 Tax=Rhodococcus jostii (strain RHA1) TaxID=101510 RepID=Q0S8P9_RHOJR|nr:hypothetical protein RHA1_ro04296 [Rhodococcus jostii RHA1]
MRPIGGATYNSEERCGAERLRGFLVPARGEGGRTDGAASFVELPVPEFGDGGELGLLESRLRHGGFSSGGRGSRVTVRRGQ